MCLLSGILGLAALVVVLSLLATLQPAPVVKALPMTGDGTWIRYTVANGLPSNSVGGGVAVDNAGQVWAGFNNGDYAYPLPTNTVISRFDGTGWFNYDLLGCAAAPIAAERQVYAGTLCGGPHSGGGGGLSWLSSAGWVNFSPADGLLGDYVSAIAPEGNNRVWIAAGYNDIASPYINLLDHKSTPSKADDQWTVYDLSLRSISQIYSIAIDPEGKHWFGTNKGILVLSADGATWMTYTGNLLNFVGDIAFDSTGNTWFTSYHSVTRFDGHTWTQYNSREEAVQANFASIMTSLNRNRVKLIYPYGLWAIEPDAGVWIIRSDPSGSTAGVGFYDGNTWTIYLGNDIDVRGIAIDHQGNVWIGTRDTYTGGVDEFIPTPNFSVSVNSSVFMIQPGETGTTDILVSHLRGWVPMATLSIAGVPTSTSGILSSNPLTPTAYSALSITTTMDTVFGIYPITITATGAAMTRTTMLTLLVVPKVYRYYWPIIFQNSGGIP
jgi:ligand-binding sensor domain-containing protein